jgi:hypothetical protein
MLKYALAGGLTLAVVAPVWAANEYYIVRGPDKHDRHDYYLHPPAAHGPRGFDRCGMNLPNTFANS